MVLELTVEVKVNVAVFLPLRSDIVRHFNQSEINVDILRKLENHHVLQYLVVNDSRNVVEYHRLNLRGNRIQNVAFKHLLD